MCVCVCLLKFPLSASQGPHLQTCGADRPCSVALTLRGPGSTTPKMAALSGRISLPAIDSPSTSAPPGTRKKLPPQDKHSSCLSSINERGREGEKEYEGERERKGEREEETEGKKERQERKTISVMGSERVRKGGERERE